MGACQFKSRYSGKTAEEAYNRACEEAEQEYGHLLILNLIYQQKI
jgi:hypothetical protein